MKSVRTLALCAALVTGCVGTEVGNPQDDDSQITVEFSADVFEDPRALTLANGIEIDEAWIGIEEVGLRETSRCEETDRFDDEARFAVELLAGSEVPRAPTLNQPATDFCRLELELESLEGEDAPAGLPEALSRSSIYVTGSLEDQTPFEAEIEFSETIRLDGPFEARGPTRFIVAFDLQAWLVPDDFAGLTAEQDGVVRLNVDTVTDEETITRIRDAIERSGRLVRDNNDNGVFDEGDEVVATSASEDL